MRLLLVNKVRQRGFTLLEVIIALAMLALIAIPAVGLATMAVSRSKEQMATGSASELKTRVDTALRSLGSAVVLSSAFITEGTNLYFWASEDLRYIEKDGQLTPGGNDKFYRIWVKQPQGYILPTNPSYRVLLYEVTWPYNTPATSRNQLFFTSVIRK